MRKRVAIIGNFGNGHVASNGQSVKTISLLTELIRQFGADNIVRINTFGGVINLLKAPFQCIKALIAADNIVILPAHNGVRVYVPLLAMLRYFFPKRRLHYDVIGGWLPDFISRKPLLRRALNKFDGIYVETKTMKKRLESESFTNVYILPNFKHLEPVNLDSVEQYSKPYRLCSFSRISKEKGIGDAVEIVCRINDREGATLFSLDIYGKVDDGSQEWFEALQKVFPDYIQYKGVVDFDKSVNVLKDYFALLFPTHYYTEGVPGTIIDAYNAGLPVISSKWESFADIVDDNVTGLGYDFDNVVQLENILVDVASNPQKILNLKQNCIEKGKSYHPVCAVKTLINNFI